MAVGAYPRPFGPYPRWVPGTKKRKKHKKKVSEATTPEPMVHVPTKQHVQSVLAKMSKLAHDQTTSAQSLGTPSAMQLAAKTHARVAHAAEMHGFSQLAKTHAAVSDNLATGKIKPLAKNSMPGGKKKTPETGKLPQLGAKGATKGASGPVLKSDTKKKSASGAVPPGPEAPGKAPNLHPSLHPHGI